MRAITRSGSDPVVRVGVVADTHVGEWTAEIPPAALASLAGVDLILHAGDITDVAVLRRLERIAPVKAVQGDHDRDAGIVLPRTRIVEVAGYRIGLIHGHRSRPFELAAAIASLIRGRAVLLGFHRSLRRRFGHVDCIVHGHLHLPCSRVVGGVLFFSPGALHNAERVPGFEAGGLRARMYLRFRRSLGHDLRRPALGIIEAGPGGLEVSIVPVDIG